MLQTGIIILLATFPVVTFPRLDDAAALINQLGNASFAERESAQKKLIQMGLKAKEAVEEGKKNGNPEVATRCARLLEQIVRQNNEKLFLPRFIQLFGDDTHTRALFSVIVSEPKNVKSLELVESDPKKVQELYLATGIELTRRCEIGVQTWDPTRLSDADVLGFLYLGTYPGSEDVKGDWQRPYLFTYVDQWQYSKTGITYALRSDSLKVGTRRLLMRWTSDRTNVSEIKAGFTCAMAYGFREVVPLAKKRLANLKVLQTKPFEDSLLDLAVIGKLGNQADIAYLSRFFDDRRVATSFFVLLRNQEIDPNTKFRVGKDCSTEIRDMAYAMALMLAGKKREDLDEAGFFVSKFYPREPSEVNKPLAPVGKRRRADDPFNCSDVGFIQQTQREAAIKQAEAWLAPYLKGDGK